MKLEKKHLHIAIIILGIIFLSLPAFHTSLWFDESYSVAIAKHRFADIWTITGNDVHPALYYWALHIICLIFGNNILLFRLFSLTATIIVGILGYTHIRKDFGERCGIFFSFLTFFLPVMTAYSQEIRMYSWSFLIITLTSIYAYRFYKNIKDKNENKRTKNLVIFGIFSICACYIHYYALITTCLINLLLLIFLIRNRKEDKKALKNFLILAGIQVILYIPWLVYLLGQIMHVHNGFWIEINPVSTPVELLSFQFRRQLDSNFVFDAHTIIALVSSVLMYIYLAFRTYKYKKENTDIKPAILSFFIYVGIIGLMLLISLIIWRPVLFSRYLFVITGLYIFWIAYMFSLEKNKILVLTICLII
ncbi:MAG: glycosyltransferase family 39 protein, partial [Clostridia bacterium]|nr:glycosyltransferase family 39 protein [Clostridia bacterium]